MATPFKTVDVTIKGISPLLMHRFPLEELDPPFDKRSREEQAELSTYRQPNTNLLYVPGANFHRALISAAVNVKGKGKASLQKQAAGGIIITTEYNILDPNTYTIDSRAAVVPATKGRIVRHRPRLDEWTATFTVTWDPSMITEDQLRKIIDICGTHVGILDFRPEKKGPFGRFIVTTWS